MSLHDYVSAASQPRPLASALLRLAGPVALARLGIMGMGIVDTIMVGQIAPHDLPFLALGWAPTAVVLVTGIGLLTGVQVLAARAVGEDKPHAAGAVWRKGMALALTSGFVAAVLLWAISDLAFSTFGVSASLAEGSARVTRVLALGMPFLFAHVACSYFLEAIQRPLPGTIVIWVANVLNLALNLALVPQLGAEGSAWSTVIGRGFMLAALVAWIWLSRDARAHGATTRSEQPVRFHALLAVGVASAVSQAAEAGAFSIMSIIAGRIGADAVAAYQILLNTLSVVFMISLGFASASAVLVSEAIGRRDVRQAARAGWMALGLNTAGMVMAGALVLLLGHFIARAFTSDMSLVALLIGIMPICALIFPPDGGQVVMAQGLRGRGDNWFPSACHIVSYVFVMPPLGFYLGEHLGWGVRGLMVAILIASIVSVGLLCARFWALSRRSAAPAAA